MNGLKRWRNDMKEVTRVGGRADKVVCRGCNGRWVYLSCKIQWAHQAEYLPLFFQFPCAFLPPVEHARCRRVVRLFLEVNWNWLSWNREIHPCSLKISCKRCIILVSCNEQRCTKETMIGLQRFI